MTPRIFSTVAMLLLSASFAPAVSADSSITADAAWVREAPPTSTVLAGYMVLTNNSDAAITIRSIESNDFETVDVHRTVIEDGIARMLPVAALDLPAGSRTVFEPGGLHLMLINPVRLMHDGDSVTLEIHHGENQHTTVTAPVKRQTGGLDHSHH